MGHLLLIQVQLFLLKKLKAASDWQKTSTTTRFECFVLHNITLQARHHVREPTH